MMGRHAYQAVQTPSSAIAPATHSARPLIAANQDELARKQEQWPRPSRHCRSRRSYRRFHLRLHPRPRRSASSRSNLHNRLAQWICRAPAIAQHGRPRGVISDDQPDTREGQVGRSGEAERSAFISVYCGPETTLCKIPQLRQSWPQKHFGAPSILARVNSL